MRKLLYTIVLALSLNSCNFLEVDQIGKSDIDTYFSEIGSLEPAMNGVYNLMNTFYERYMLIYPEVAGDLMYLSSKNTEWDRQYNFTSRYEDETTVVGYIWKNGYNIIQNANYIIRYAPDLRDGVRDRLVNNILAQAYFARAVIHFELCRVYAQPYNFTADGSHLGIAIMDHTPGIREKMVRSSVSEVYTQVINDLNYALSLFDNPDFNEYRIGPDACKALLARVYLYKGDYARAAEYSAGLMAKFSLTPRADYRNMFTSIGTRGGEGIFRLNNLVNTMALSSFYRYENPAGRPSLKLKAVFTDSRDIRLSLFTHTAYSEALKKKVIYEDVNMKYFCTDSIADNLKHYDPFIFRVSEMYLINAEASLKLGDEAKAVSDIKALESRALGIPEQEVVLTYSSTEGLMDLIKTERQKELCFEGHRLFDITRYKESLSRDSGTNSTVRTIKYPDYRFVIPIPQIEMESNDKMIQNPSSNDEL